MDTQQPQNILHMYMWRSLLTGSTTWYGSCTAIESGKLCRGVVRTAQYITGVQLPNLLDLYTTRCLRKTRRVLKDSTHPSHCLFSQLPSGRRFRSIKSRTSRLRDSSSSHQATEQPVVLRHRFTRSALCHLKNINQITVYGTVYGTLRNSPPASISSRTDHCNSPLTDPPEKTIRQSFPRVLTQTPRPESSPRVLAQSNRRDPINPRLERRTLYCGFGVITRTCSGFSSAHISIYSRQSGVAEVSLTQKQKLRVSTRLYGADVRLITIFTNKESFSSSSLNRCKRTLTEGWDRTNSGFLTDLEPTVIKNSDIDGPVELITHRCNLPSSCPGPPPGRTRARFMASLKRSPSPTEDCAPEQQPRKRRPLGESENPADDEAESAEGSNSVDSTQNTTDHPATVDTTQNTTGHPATVDTTQNTTDHPATVDTTQNTTDHPATVDTTQNTTDHPATMENMDPCEFLCDVNTEGLKAADPLYSGPSDGDGGVHSLLLPEVHYQLFGPVDVERKVILPGPVCQEADLLSVGLLVVIGDQAHSCSVICRFDDDIGAVSGCTVVRIQGIQERAEHTTLGGSSAK
ncbi:hypothetical protein NFI96_019146, partial [Prochilodus magdalenae]